MARDNRTPEQKAKEVLVDAYRAKYPRECNRLSNESVFSKIPPDVVARVTSYYRKLEASHERLDKKLLNIP